jgi:hypothetical protein
MNYQILFAGLCAVIAANILVAVIAIIRAYREEKRIRRFSGFTPGLNRRSILKTLKKSVRTKNCLLLEGSTETPPCGFRRDFVPLWSPCSL